MPYVDQRHTLAWTTVRRERLLPDHTYGEVNARAGQHVNLREIVARGSVPARYVFLEAARQLRLSKPEDLNDLLLVEAGDRVQAGQALAGKNPERGRRVLSPVEGVIVYTGEGRIIVQATPERVEVEAGLVGQVVEVRPERGVMIEAFGALIQGVWGNNRRMIGPLRLEPEEDGLEGIFDDLIDRQYSGAVVVTRRSLKATGLMMIENQGIGGVIAPSMDAGLYEQAINHPAAIILTQGFGDLRMSTQVLNILEGLVGRQTTLDAFLPDRWDTRRPEVFINLPAKAGERPPEPRTAQMLREGMTVRITRAPHMGSVGQIMDLPKTPQLLDNGLRTLCAQVSLATGETPLVPLANLEVFGR